MEARGKKKGGGGYVVKPKTVSHNDDETSWSEFMSAIKHDCTTDGSETDWKQSLYTTDEEKGKRQFV